jgi:capsular polysaccharide biosynthesis protein
MHLREYVLVLRRRWWVVAVAALVALATSYGLARSQPPIYRSSVKLEVTGRIDYGQILAIDKLLRQLAARVTTMTVAEAVDQRLRLNMGADALLGELHTQAFSDTLQIQIDVDDADPARAERIAGAFAEIAQERQNAAMTSVPVAERVNLTLLDRPTPGRLFSPQTRSIALAGGLLGLLVGFILVFVLDYLDETFRGPADVERSLGLPVVGVVPGLPPPPRRGTAREGVTRIEAFNSTGQDATAPPPQPSPARGGGGRPA